MVIHQDPEVIPYLGSGVPGDITVAWHNVAMMIGHWHMKGYGPRIIVAKDIGGILDGQLETLRARDSVPVLRMCREPRRAGSDRLAQTCCETERVRS